MVSRKKIEFLLFTDKKVFHKSKKIPFHEWIKSIILSMIPKKYSEGDYEIKTIYIEENPEMNEKYDIPNIPTLYMNDEFIFGGDVPEWLLRRILKGRFEELEKII
ncbi:MAG: hypothetical protein HWN67_10045 [Candidatus Helarchaeota archaeon]|nr:hypothetical protein [Candidatus Helarchaeota archaeon]